MMKQTRGLACDVETVRFTGLTAGGALVVTVTT